MRNNQTHNDPRRQQPSTTHGGGFNLLPAGGVTLQNKMKTYQEIIGAEKFKELENEFQFYNMTELSRRTGELKFSEWLAKKHNDIFDVVKNEMKKELAAQAAMMNEDEE